MEWDRDGWVVLALRAKRAPKYLFPKFYWREPEKGVLDDWFFMAYGMLGTERKFQGGPIPWSSRMELADMHGLSMDAGLFLGVVITQIDQAFWDFQKESAEQEEKAKGEDQGTGTATKDDRWGRG